MAEAAVRRFSEEEASIHEENVNLEQSSQKGESNMAGRQKKRRTRSSSKSSTKKNDTDSKFAAFESKMEERFTFMMDMFKTTMETFSTSQERTREERDFRETNAQTVHNGGSATLTSTRIRDDPYGMHNSENENSPQRNDIYQDVLSLAPGQSEREHVISDDSDDCVSHRSLCSDLARVNSVGKDKFKRYIHTDENDDNNNKLCEIFGDISSSSKDDVGIVLDDSQKAIINNSWRSSDPDKVTAYKEEYKLAFPVQEKSRDILKVPALDDLLEPLLRKQHNSFRAWGKSKHLASPQLKGIESSAYQGQIAARMGIISVTYIQQALGLLLNNLKSTNSNLDSAIQSVRDIFEMSTKTLDQVGRTGAFHHLIRRKAAIADTGLHSVKDVQAKIQNLPLSGDGVFGTGLEEKLKQRKDQKEQLSDLLPEYTGSNAMKSQKRKFSYFSDSSYRGNSKRQRYDYSDRRRGQTSTYQRSYDNAKSRTDNQGKERKSFTSSSFRIPKKK
ncbi:hypothetical protein FSP39_017216 [Pinctada imbricata]|uniref:Uncharacterized protein n=1 Tax=Pinctada imbricata TaxID=66713 RepID=A0AA89C3Q0_PINIB|nr:hypothetical protein FSP39_017216 [Pinctada imbricata]